jgi:hypothetical protein
MDIPKKEVSMEEVIEYRVLQKARSGPEEKTSLLFLLNVSHTCTSIVILQTTLIHGYFL